MKGCDNVARPAMSSKTTSKHLTKQETEAKANVEERLKGNDIILTAPDYLSDSQKEIFDYIVDNLTASGILGGLDIYVLTECSICIDRMQEIEKDINKHGLSNPLITMKEKYTKAFFRYCNELCLSPQSRAKIANICVQNEDSENPLIKALLSDD